VARATDDGAAPTSAAKRSPCSLSIPLGSIWLLAFAVTYADALILGSRFPDAVVGGYMFAYVWAFFASRVLQQPIGRALYPALVQFGDQPDQQFLAYRLATKVLLAIEVPAALFLFLNADLAVQLLGGERYAGQAGLLRLLAFAPLVDPLGRFGGELLVALHRDRDRILSLVLHLTALVGGGLWLSPTASARWAWRGPTSWRSARRC
jgi:O-antigen/teichoic acid export membrane protein